MPQNSLNLAGFNEDDAENIYENRRRFLKLFDGDWTLAGCWQIHSADVRVVHDEQEAQPKPGVLGDDQYCDALVSNTPKILLAVKTADCVPDPDRRFANGRFRRGARRLARDFRVDRQARDRASGPGIRCAP